MKLHLTLPLPLLTLALTQSPATVLAAPADDAAARVRVVATDQLLFHLSLRNFVRARNRRVPADLDWSSDECSNSPDNPFGFPFQPACERHDFGYRNYKAQGRFTPSSRSAIDSNLRSDLYYQCDSVVAKKVCTALADVYYAAVRAFGGSSTPEQMPDAAPASLQDAPAQDPARPADKKPLSYEEALAAYNEAVVEAQTQGLLPALEED
ncbi:hypothetical protein E4U41_002838 [Claviceps citrina]|nr:hypothetical protein E4U41_002838 [Claviceps citrina]